MASESSGRAGRIRNGARTADIAIDAEMAGETRARGRRGLAEGEDP